MDNFIHHHLSSPNTEIQGELKVTYSIHKVRTIERSYPLLLLLNLYSRTNTNTDLIGKKNLKSSNRNSNTKDKTYENKSNGNKGERCLCDTFLKKQ
jgi:hypothetical protein